MPAVSNMCTNRNASTTLIMLTLNTPATSMAIQVGARLGGIDITPPNLTRPRPQPARVTPMMLIRIAPNTRL
ncbi:hypothetical protein D3C71_2115710 [compost metagenome]